MELLHNYYTTPNSNNVPVEQEVNRINTVIKPEKDEVQSSNTNHIYQNIQKNNQEKKFGQFHFSYKVQKIKNFNHQILK